MNTDKQFEKLKQLLQEYIECNNLYFKNKDYSALKKSKSLAERIDLLIDCFPENILSAYFPDDIYFFKNIQKYRYYQKIAFQTKKGYDIRAYKHFEKKILIYLNSSKQAACLQS